MIKSFEVWGVVLIVMMFELVIENKGQTMMEMQMMMLALVIENKGQTRLARRVQTVSLSLAYVLWACITRVWHSQSWWGWGRIYWIMQRSHTHQCLTNYHVEIPAFERFWQNPENPFGVLLLKYIDPSDIHEEELRPQIKDYHHHSSGDVSDKLENKSLHAGIFSSGNAFQYFGGWGRVCLWMIGKIQMKESAAIGAK